MQQLYWRLFDYILGRGEDSFSAAEACAALACSRRSFYRQLAALQAQGLPLGEQRDPGDGRVVRYGLQAGFTALGRPGLVTPAEHTALEFLARALPSLAGQLFKGPVDTLRRKVAAACAERGQRPVLSLPTTVVRYGPDTDRLMAALQEAIGERRVVRFAYRSPWRCERRPRRYEVLPLRLLVRWDDVYLYALKLGEAGRGAAGAPAARGRAMPRAAAGAEPPGALRLFSVLRLRDLQPTGQRRPAPAIDEAALASAFGVFMGQAQPVRLRFDAAFAGYLAERCWHPSQRFAVRRDGSALLSMRVVLGPELLAWVLGFGPAVEVLAPAALRAQVAALAAATAARYAAGASGKKS